MTRVSCIVTAIPSWIMNYIIFIVIFLLSIMNYNNNNFVYANYLEICLNSLEHQALPCHPTNNATFCSVNSLCSRIGVKRDDGDENCSLLLLPTAKQIQEEIKHHLHERPTAFEVWTFGGIAVGIISLSGVSGAVLWPLLQSQLYKHIMRLLIGLAVGSLTSTAVFQLIPEGFQLKDTDPDLNYMTTALYAWFSIWFLFSVEGLTKILFKSSDKKKKHPSTNGVVITSTNNTVPPTKEHELNSLITEAHHTNVIGLTKREPGEVSNVAWMIIFGDGLHNLIDGMSIGAGFSQSIATGFSISLAIACEEFPHELGDFAILIQSGLPLPRALLYNFLSACTAFIGLALGIILGELEGSHYIFAFAGGLFLYVSLTHLIPELQDMLDEGLQKSRIHGLRIFALQNIGILTGSTILYFITRYNDLIRISYEGGK
ncbi:metal cation symporter ZIP8-like [Lycorma delicatula]|uniref:metal cation symporter ZIP8-like n=1 Tax=Lycorma delicatula TaxID=130591 RepID=UPI003F50D4B5